MAKWTQEEYEEVLKCRKDFTYFAEKYLQIVHPKKGLVPFTLYEFQKRVIKEFEENPYCIVKKFRQAGLTTVASMWLLWKCLFFTDQRIMIISKTDREARGVGRTIAATKSKLPPFLQPEMGNDNDHEKEFAETGSVMWFFTPSAARSRSLTYLVLDEAAFIPGMDEHWAAIYPTLATGGNCIVISTVHGVGNWYHTTYSNAKEKRNEFHIVAIDWREHPDYNNPDWEKKTRRNLGPKKFAQEIEGSFLDSGETYIPGDVISDYEKTCCDPIKKALPDYDTMPEEAFDPKKYMLPNKSYEPGAMWVWENPKPGREYIIAADAAEGVGEEGDNCAFIILDLVTLTQVAEFYSNTIPTYKFAQVLKQIATIYNTALLVVENSLGPGQAVCDRLQHSLHYENLYFTTGASRDKPGLNLHKTIRPVCMEALQTCMLNKVVKLRSTRIIKELCSFVYNVRKQRAEARNGSHDDLIVCLASALYVADIMNREIPLLSSGNGMQDSDLITQVFNNEDYHKLRAELEEGMFDDVLADEAEIDLLPKVMFDVKINKPKILQEFGW